jgi:crossover junction endodeoxyribonuclease RuvC
MSALLVVGLDPGFASLGYAVVELLPLPAAGERVVDMGVIRTQKSDAKRNTLAADDNIRRAREIFRELRDLIKRHATQGDHLVAVCAEAMSFPRNASAASKVALAWGVVAAILERAGLPLAQASPQQVKKAVCGRKDASKEDIQAALISKYQFDPKAMSGMEHVGATLREHPFDALASVVCCLDSEVLRMARKFGPQVR